MCEIHELQDKLLFSFITYASIQSDHSVRHLPAVEQQDKKVGSMATIEDDIVKMLICQKNSKFFVKFCKILSKNCQIFL